MHCNALCVYKLNLFYYTRPVRKQYVIAVLDTAIYSNIGKKIIGSSPIMTIIEQVYFMHTHDISRSYHGRTFLYLHRSQAAKGCFS